MPLAVVTATSKDTDEEKEDMVNEVVEEAATYMKTGLTSNMSPVILKMQIGIHYQTRQEKDNRGPGSHYVPDRIQDSL